MCIQLLRLTVSPRVRNQRHRASLRYTERSRVRLRLTVQQDRYSTPLARTPRTRMPSSTSSSDADDHRTFVEPTQDLRYLGIAMPYFDHTRFDYALLDHKHSPAAFMAK